MFGLCSSCSHEPNMYLFVNIALRVCQKMFWNIKWAAVPLNFAKNLLLTLQASMAFFYPCLPPLEASKVPTDVTYGSILLMDEYFLIFVAECSAGLELVSSHFYNYISNLMCLHCNFLICNLCLCPSLNCLVNVLIS